jgi:quinol monooxygenase YgiN
MIQYQLMTSQCNANEVTHIQVYKDQAVIQR